MRKIVLCYIFLISIFTSSCKQDKKIEQYDSPKLCCSITKIDPNESKIYAEHKPTKEIFTFTINKTLIPNLGIDDSIYYHYEEIVGDSLNLKKVYTHKVFKNDSQVILSTSSVRRKDVSAITR